MVREDDDLLEGKMERLRGGIVGLGRMGITHYGILNSHPQVEIVGACDESSYVTQVFKDFKKIRIYKRSRDLLAQEDLDFIVICTPVESHYEIITEAIDRNIHVFTEKPFTYTVEQGEKLIESLDLKRATSSHSLVNQVGYVNRYNAIFSHVKTLLEENLIGGVKNFSCEINGRVVIKESRSGWRSQKKAGGGCMLELASHALNLLIWYFGVPKGVYGGVKQKIYSTEVEDFVQAGLIFDNGLVGSLTSNWSDETLRKVTEKIEINGMNGKMVVTRQLLRIYLKSSNGNGNGYGHGYEKGWNSVYIADVTRPVRFYLRGNEFTLQLDDFIESILHKREHSRSDFASANETDKVIQMINQSALEV